MQAQVTIPKDPNVAGKCRWRRDKQGRFLSDNSKHYSDDINPFTPELKKYKWCSENLYYNHLSSE